MIRINRRSINKQEERRSKIMLIKERQIREELESVDYNLDENTCIFRINPVFNIHARFIGVSVFIQPLVGLFKDIEFRPVLYFKSEAKNYTFQPPRIYNDRRIFHPNINIQDCQVIIPELYKDWNPSHTYLYILRRLKYVIIQPNPHCIPNTHFNRRAAFFYKMRRQKYREEIIKNSPKFLQSSFELHPENAYSYDEDMFDENQQREIEREFFDIEELFDPKRKNLNTCFQDDDGELQMQRLSKEIKKITLEDAPIVKNRDSERGQKYPVIQICSTGMEMEEQQIQGNEHQQIKITKQKVIHF